MKVYTMPKISLKHNRRNVATKTKPAVVEIEIYHNAKRRRISTGVFLKLSQWKDDRVVNHPNSFRLNKLLNEQLEKVTECVERLCAQQDEFDVDNLPSIRFVENKKSVTEEKDDSKIPDLFEWLRSRLREKNIAPRTKGHHELMFKSLKESKLFKTFDDITLININRYDAYLHGLLGRHGQELMQSTVFGYHRCFKIYTKEAELYGYIKKNPYNFIHIAHGSSKNIKYLTDEEKERIENVELDDNLSKVRDLFLLACYTGLSFSDMIKIKKSDIRLENGRTFIEDYRQKTKSRYKITLLPKALTILEKYDYNMNVVTNAYGNRLLKTIANLAKVDKPITMHMGRHTFATWALRHGIKIEVVSKMLAHADIKTTQTYAKVLQESVDEGFDALSKI